MERVGGNESIDVDVRVVAASNKDLAAGVSQGRFRDDLFYRLNVFPIRVPPLRERRSDIVLLATHFVAMASKKLGKAFAGISPASITALESYGWPGNVRELQNVIDRAAILSSGPLLEIGDALDGGSQSFDTKGTLEEVERSYIKQVLDETAWMIEGEGGAARRLGLNASTLRGRMRKLGLTREA